MPRNEKKIYKSTACFQIEGTQHLNLTQTTVLSTFRFPGSTLIDLN